MQQISEIKNKINNINNYYQLNFIDSNNQHHYEYIIDNNKYRNVLSVSQVANTNEINYDLIKNINWYIGVGNNCHLVAEFVAKKFNIPEIGIYENLRQNLINFFINKEIIEVEQNLIFLDFDLCGKFDMLYMQKNKLILQDYKTSAIIMPEHHLQLNIYAFILKYTYNICVDQMRICQIDKSNGNISFTIADKLNDDYVYNVIKERYEKEIRKIKWK